MNAGIDDIEGYVGRAFLNVERLAEVRKLNPSRYRKLLMRGKSVNLPCEDPVTNAVNAAMPLLARRSKEEIKNIEYLVVGTESGLDFGKPLSTYIHELLELPRTCRSFEVKHACYGGTLALQTALAMVATSQNPESLALVICSDSASRIDIDSYWEPAQGAGAIAILISSKPSILALDIGNSGFCSYHVMDTFRPRADTEVGNSDLSVASYLTCLEESYRNYIDKNPGSSIRDFDHLFFHIPFVGILRGAHRLLMRKSTDFTRLEIEQHFSESLEKSSFFSRDIGNVYGSAIYFSLCSTLAFGNVQPGHRACFFSYGSGCGSEFYSGIFREGFSQCLGPGRIAQQIDERYELDIESYELISTLSEQRFSGVIQADMSPDLYAEAYQNCMEGSGLARLKKISNYERIYGFA